MGKGWEVIERIGAGGQGEVFKARRPEAAKYRREAAQTLVAIMKDEVPLLCPREEQRDINTIRRWGIEAMPGLVKMLLCDDDPAQLGALKRFAIAGLDDAERAKAISRLEQEVAALRAHTHSAILRLLDDDLASYEMVTEYHPLGSLQNHLARFRGDVAGSLAALIPVVDAVAKLHKAGFVHRDIKVPNIFVAGDGGLVLGDFGLIFYQDAEATRVTSTYESTGSHHWMPAWVDFGRRLEDVPPSFDVFALGKVLWCMIAGERTLRLWYYKRYGNNLEERFPRQPEMAMVNAILRDCVVEEEKDCKSAEELLGSMSEALRVLQRGGVMLREAGTFPCRICVRGQYQMLPTGEGETRLLPMTAWKGTSGTYPAPNFAGALPIRVARCNACGHLELFECPNGELPEAWQRRGEG